MFLGYENLSHEKRLCPSALCRRRLMHTGKVIYWSAPHSNKLNMTCSEYCHEMT